MRRRRRRRRRSTLLVMHTNKQKNLAVSYEKKAQL